jgi:hypothetical protein
MPKPLDLNFMTRGREDVPDDGGITVDTYGQANEVTDGIETQYPRESDSISMGGNRSDRPLSQGWPLR